MIRHQPPAAVRMHRESLADRKCLVQHLMFAGVSECVFHASEKAREPQTCESLWCIPVAFSILAMQYAKARCIERTWTAEEPDK